MLSVFGGRRSGAVHHNDDNNNDDDDGKVRHTGAMVWKRIYAELRRAKGSFFCHSDNNDNDDSCMTE